MKQMIYHFRKSNLNQLEYWFDGRKMPEAIIAITLQAILYQNNTLTTEGNALFDAIWANTKPSTTNPNGLRGELFDLSATATKTPKQQFIDIIADVNNSFYNFIKVK